MFESPAGEAGNPGLVGTFRTLEGKLDERALSAHDVILRRTKESPGKVTRCTDNTQMGDT